MTQPSASTASRWLLAVVLTVQFMVALDMSVVNVALPAIGHDLAFAPDSLPWVINAYALTFGGFMMLGGRIGDIVGRRRTLLAGLVLFGAASLVGGLVNTSGGLITARALQGIGAAALAPIALTLITVNFPAGPARSRAIGLWGATAAVGGAVGVLAGGILTESTSWRGVMLINIPIVLFALAAAFRGIPADKRDVPKPRLDLAGALLITAGTSTLVYGVIRTETHGWSSATTLGTFGIALILLAIFVTVELRTTQPLLRMRLLTHRPVIGANIFMLLLFSGQFAAFYFVSLYLQHVLAYGPAAAGAAFLPFSLGIIIGSIIATKSVARLGLRSLLVIGAMTGAVGFGWFAIAFDTNGSFIASILGPSLVASIGIGMCFVPLGTAATAGVDPHEAGMASGLISSSRQIGGSIGLAALVALATATTNSHGGAPTTALVAGYGTAVGVGGGLLALAGLVALVLIPRGNSRPPKTPLYSRDDKAMAPSPVPAVSARV